MMKKIEFVALILSGCWIIITLIYCILLWKRRRHPFISYRNPLLLCLSIFGSNLPLTAQLRHHEEHHFACYISFSSRSLYLTLHIIPLVLRGFQYLVHTNVKFRRKFPKFRQNMYTMKCILVFAILHYGLNNMYFFTVKNNNCDIRGEYRIILPQFIIVIFAMVFIFSQIPWSFDAYRIGLEMKVMVACWTICYGIALYFISGSDPDLVAVYMAVISAIMSVFLVTVVIPVHLSARSGTERRSKTVYVKTKGQSMKELSKRRKTKNSFGSKYFEEGKLSLNQFQTNSSPSLALDDIFSDPDATAKFHAYTARHFVPEISLFLHSVFKFRSLATSDIHPQVLYHSYMKISDDFLKANSPYEINICSEARQRILGFNSNMDGFISLCLDDQIAIFDEPFCEMECLLRSNFPQISAQKFHDSKSKFGSPNCKIVNSTRRRTEMIFPGSP